MYSKFVTVLSVVVLAAVVQAHENESSALSLGDRKQYIDKILDQALSIYGDSMNAAFVNLPTRGIDEATMTYISIPGLPSLPSLPSMPNLSVSADDLFNKLKGLIDAAFNKAREGIQYAKDKVNEVADKAQSLAKEQIQGVEDGLRKEIDAVKDKAKTAGIDVTDCLTGNEDRLLDLPNKYSGELVHCVSDQVNKALGYADDALNKIQNVIDTVTNIKKEIDDCGSGFKAFICLTKLGVTLAKDIVVLPLEIEADMTQAVASITRIATEVEKCGTDKVTKMGSEGTEIMSTITVCVAAKGI